MSLISTFITNQLVKALEAEFVAHEADVQSAFVGEVQALASTVMSWANDKITAPKPIQSTES